MVMMRVGTYYHSTVSATGWNSINNIFYLLLAIIIDFVKYNF